MVKRVTSIFLSILMLCSASIALAGGAPVGPPVSYPAKPCGPGGVPSNYWGDAPFPGICGGVVALPFLVVGSLLGGNPMGPGPSYGGPMAGPMAGPGYAGPAPCGPPAPYPCAPPPVVKCPPAPCGPGYGYGGGGSFLSGLPCLEICSGILGGVGGSGFLY